jgi:hypothetical protein
MQTGENLRVRFPHLQHFRRLINLYTFKDGARQSNQQGEESGSKNEKVEGVWITVIAKFKGRPFV